VTEYEIYSRAALGQVQFWDTFLMKVQVLPFDKVAEHTTSTLFTAAVGALCGTVCKLHWDWQ